MRQHDVKKPATFECTCSPAGLQLAQAYGSCLSAVASSLLLSEGIVFACRQRCSVRGCRMTCSSFQLAHTCCITPGMR